MNILVTNNFPPKIPTHSWPTPTRGGGDSAEGTQNFKKGRQAPPPPWGSVSKPLKKGLLWVYEGGGGGEPPPPPLQPP